MFWTVGEREESEKYYNQALTLARELNLKDKQEECESALEICRLFVEGDRFFDSGEYQKSIDCFAKAVDIAERTGSKEHKGRCIRQLSIAYWELNDFEKFGYLNEEGLRIAKELNHRKEIGRCLNNIGIFYWKSNNYSQALAYFKDSIKIAQKEKNKENEAECLNNIGAVYSEMGSYEKSEEYFSRALSINKWLQKYNSIIRNLNNLGEIYSRKGNISGRKEDFNIALDYFYECLKLAREKGKKKSEILVINNIGFLYLELKIYKDALDYFRSGYKKAEQLYDVELMGMLQDNIGIVQYNFGDYEESIKSYERAIELANKINAGHILWEAYFGLGQCYEKKNSHSQALVFYKKAIDIIENIRSQIFIDAYKAGYIRDKFRAYEYLVNLLFDLDRNVPSKRYAKELFSFVERAKAKAFLESLGDCRANIRERLNPELKKRENEISNRISLIMQELSRFKLSEKRRKELLDNLKQEEDEYLSLLSRISGEAPEIRELVLPVSCQVEQVQNILGKHTALIEYFLGESKSYVFYVTKDKFEINALPPRSEIERSLKAYLKMLSDSPKKRFKSTLAAQRISRELIFPLCKDIPESIENLIIAPDGILYYLPFETLMPSNRDQLTRKKFLIEKYNISYVPSSSILMFLSEKKHAYENPKMLLAFGDPSYTLKSSTSKKNNKTDVDILREMYIDLGFDFSPLPYSKQEVLEISRYFPDEKKDIYLENRAREEIFKKSSLEDYRIIHFACHGLLSEEYPYRSALVLSLDDDSQEDGFLQVREIYNLRVGADLVVLSACQTGKGKMEKGEGVLGLPRIFFYAGARSVVLTLWKINDQSTAEFMNLFYFYLSRGHDKSQALRLSKLKMLNSKFNHPFYWAGFVLNGNFNSVMNFR